MLNKHTLTMLHVGSNLNLYLEMMFEVSEECDEDSEGQFKHFVFRTRSVLTQSHAQVLFDGVDEQLIGAEHGARVLQYG